MESPTHEKICFRLFEVSLQTFTVKGQVRSKWGVVSFAFLQSLLCIFQGLLFCTCSSSPKLEFDCLKMPTWRFLLFVGTFASKGFSTTIWEVVVMGGLRLYTLILGCIDQLDFFSKLFHPLCYLIWCGFFWVHLYSLSKNLLKAQRSWGDLNFSSLDSNKLWLGRWLNERDRRYLVHGVFQ